MRATRPLLAAAVMSLAAACSEDSPTTPSHPALPGSQRLPEAHGTMPLPIVVMTRNLYVGADVDAVIAALVTPDPGDDFAALGAAIATLQETDFPSRAAAFAEEIARARPHVIGLQEVSKIDLVLPPLGIDLHLDFMPVLLSELSARGLAYEVATRVRNIEAVPFPGVSLIDEDAILIDRSRVTASNPAAQRFTANLGQVAPGVVLARGWVTAGVTIGSQSYLIASTHLESGDSPGLDQLRAAQAAELAQALPGAAPTVLMGDLNDLPGSPMHRVLTEAGFTDVWSALRPGADGHTCCHASDLSNPLSRFEKRIDYIFVREDARRVTGRISRVGEVLADRIPGPAHQIWPSDHAGLVAWLR